MQLGSPDAVLAAIAQSSNEVTQGWMRLLASAPASAGAAPWLADLQRNSAKLGAMQAAYFEKQSKLWSGLLAGQSASLADPAPGDRRFSAKEWRDNAYYDYLRQSYLLASRYLEELVEGAELDAQAKERARFAVRQWIDAMCPANFAATNPEAMQQALESRGESLTRGLANLMSDVQKGRISQTDDGAFEVGRNLAVTPGQVVYENELIQLIQYAPTTAQVAGRPLVIVPPCINKYYVLDLQPENSFVAHAVASGNTVFMLSWRNAGPEISHLTWDDYLDKGVLTASRAAREICGSDRVNALGVCVGGTLLGAAFDLLFWNSDSANLPGPMYCYYVRNTYLENRLKQPGALVNCGVPVDLGKVKLPVFVLSTREDHIVPWRSAYRTLSLLGEEKTFVLGASGHIAGIVNPPAKKRRSYWVGEPYPDDPDAWLKDAREERGSWWPFWSEWLARQAGGTRAAPSAPGSARYRPIEPAPGRYVKQKAN